ncbi:NADPH-dependent FMN reductase [Aidingimonas halophila]|uniref:NAD(P)H-dependent FMN reductase n=1 Tax=Aidingimonas halophila TaxID=574349 RepID=A0A1H3FJ57_9GAMM|nr:NAD(P)H-dependent oxidoreductase [Aidingimonas halophila]GHC37843.1 FMN reductase [Aidingimonas halophila]SDX90408.1 NAD(P)H-dependent FMN reductase [Aidingimonas halophila]
MSDTPQLLCFAGSARRQSFNKRLAHLAASRLEAHGADVTLIDLADYPMPLYDGDLEAEQGVPEPGQRLKALFRDSDGFLIAAPEYNSSLAPLLKNTLDWISRRETAEEPPLAAFRGKVAGLCATSPGGFGGLRGLVPLRMMLGNIGVHVLPQQLAVAHARDAFDDQDSLADEQHRQTLDALCAELVRVSHQLRQ